jgi:hypothetical protein
MISVFVAALSLLSWQVPQDVDRLIERLPEIERQGQYDAEKNETVWEPEVLALRDYLDSGGVLSDDQWRLALERSGAIRVRPRWPVQEPLAISVEVPAWLKDARIIVVPVRSDFTSARSVSRSGCGTRGLSSSFQARYQAIGVLALGPQVLELRITVERIPGWRRRDAPAQSPRILWQGILAPMVEGVHAVEEVLPGVSDPELDAAVRSALDIHRVEEVSLFGNVARVPELAETAVSLHVEVRRGNELHDEATLAIHRRNAFMQFEMVDVPDGSLTGWNLHIRGVADGTLREWSARRHWDGELVIPLVELERP